MIEIDLTKCPYYRDKDKCRIYDVGVRECHKFPSCMYRKWQRAEIQLAKLKNKECLYGGNNCYKTMLDIITDESEE